MRVYIILLALVLGSSSSFSQDIKINEGSKIIFEVSGFGTYDYTVVFSKLKPDLIMDWTMSHREDMFGQVIVYKSALKNGTELYNYMEPGSHRFSKKTSVVVSRKVFKSISKSETIEIDAGSGPMRFRFLEKVELPVTYKNKTINLPVIHIQSYDSNEDLWIWDNKKFPLILKMDLSFVITIKEIVN